MGFTESLKKMFSTDPKAKPLEQSLEKWGLKIIADKKLKDRLLLLQEFFDGLNAEITDEEPLDYVDALRKKQEMLNRAIHSLATPYYRSGTNAQFREIMEGWQLWDSVAKYLIEAVTDRIKSIQEEKEPKDKDKQDVVAELLQITAIDIETLVRRLHTVLALHIWQDGQLVISESYLNPDVSESMGAIIKTMTPGYGQRLELDDVMDRE